MKHSALKPTSLTNLCAICALLCSLTIAAQARGIDAGDYKKGVDIYENGIQYKAFPYFQRAANAGNAKAMFYLGFMYVDNEDNTPQVRNNYEEALKWFQKSAALGDTRSMNWIGLYYELGIMGYLNGGTGFSKAKNLELAKKWYVQAGDAGDAEGYFKAGKLYHSSHAQNHDADALYWFKKAVALKHRTAILWIEDIYKKETGTLRKETMQWFHQVADAGNTDAMLWLGDDYRDGTGVEKNPKKAIQWYAKAGDDGDVKGYIRIGGMYLRGKGVKEDSKQAEKWFQKAADTGDTYAPIWVGNEYLGDHKGDKKFPEQAIRWYKKAIAQGNVLAGTLIGFMYSEGDGVPKNEELAKKWYDLGFGKSGEKREQKFQQNFQAFQQEARPGNPKAMFMLGRSYQYGWGVEGDDQKSFEWYKKAAFYGDAKAMLQVATLYREGRGAKQDYTKAMLYYQMAAISGNAEAMNSIGNLYSKGIGVDKNIDIAKKWWLKAAQHGSVLARGNLERLEKKNNQ